MASVFRATFLGVNNSCLERTNAHIQGFSFLLLRNSFYSLWKRQTQNHMLLLHYRGFSAHLVEKNGIFILIHKGTCLLKMGLGCDGKGLSQSLLGGQDPSFHVVDIVERCYSRGWVFDFQSAEWKVVKHWSSCWQMHNKRLTIADQVADRGFPH